MCFTNDPPTRVAAALSRVRELATEIVVAVDARVDAASLGPLDAIADQVIRAEFAPPLEANLAWLHEQATGDWVLRLDGDDVVSDALIDRLQTPGWDVGITHAFVSYRWLWPDAAHALTQPPWWPDPALRLIRNIPGIARFPHGAHQPPVVAGDMRFLDEPIFHLDLVLADENTRAGKVDRYERDARGHRIDQGWSVNSTYYLPERLRTRPHVLPLDEADAAAVSAVLAAGDGVAIGPPPHDLRLVTLTDRKSQAPVPGDLALRAIANRPVVAVTGRTYTVTIALANRGGRTLRPDEANPTTLLAVLRDPDGTDLAAPVSSPLPCPVAPGDETLVRVAIPYFPDTGPALLHIDAVQQGGLPHDASLDIPIDIQWGRRVLLSTGVSPTRHLGDDLITRAIVLAITRDLPDVVPLFLGDPEHDQGARFGCQTIMSPAAARPATVRPGEDPARWAADLVADAERIASGLEPLDEDNGLLIQPFVAASALIIATGGGLASRYGDAIVAARALEVRVADAVGLPVIVEGVHVGELDRRVDRRNIVRTCRSARRITVRDLPSATALLELGAVESLPRLVPDPATGMLEVATRLAGPEVDPLLRDRGLDPTGPLVLLSLRGGIDGPAQARTVRSLIEGLPRGSAVVFLPHMTDEVHNDLTVVESEPWLAERCTVLTGDIDDYLAVALIARADLVIGSRFHQALLARWSGVPAVALVHDEYDARRYAALDADPGLRMVLDDDDAAAVEALSALLALGRTEPRGPWDGAEFAYEISGILPPSPTLA